jgi:hypothetical protein
MLAEHLSRLAADRRLAKHAGFWWGFAEGVLFFVVPDAYISLATLFSIGAGAIAWAWSILGSLAAVTVIYFNIRLGFDYLALLDAIPGISPAMIARVTRELSTAGLPWTPLLVAGGVPLKVYGGVAFSLGLPYLAVMGWTVFARVVRIAPTFIVAGVLRLLLARRIDRHATLWLVLLVAFWVVFYLFYFRMMGAPGP